MSLPLVFLIGAPSLFVTRWIYAAHNPEDFIGDSPSISGTASHAPSSEFFMYAMLVTVICICISWSLNFLMNAKRIADAERPGENLSSLARLNWASCLAGIVAGTFLAVLGIQDLNNAHDVHMVSAWVFYISQVLAILFDTICVVWLGRISGLNGRVECTGRRARIAFGVGLLLSSLFFLYMYLTKDSAAPDQRYVMQLIYVGAEYTVALLCFAYPMVVYGEIRRHYCAPVVARR